MFPLGLHLASGQRLNAATNSCIEGQGIASLKLYRAAVDRANPQAFISPRR